MKQRIAVSAFLRADGQAGHDVALEEGVSAGDGDHDQHHQHHPQGLGGHLGRLVNGRRAHLARHPAEVLHVVLELHQQGLEGLEDLVPLDIQQGQMGISKPADLKSQHRGGENRESTIVENYLVLYSYVP